MCERCYDNPPVCGRWLLMGACVNVVNWVGTVAAVAAGIVVANFVLK